MELRIEFSTDQSRKLAKEILDYHDVGYVSIPSPSGKTFTLKFIEERWYNCAMNTLSDYRFRTRHNFHAYKDGVEDY